MSAFLVFWLDCAKNVATPTDASILIETAAAQGLNVRETAATQPAVHAALRKMVSMFECDASAFILVDDSLDTSEAFLDPFDYVREGGPSGPLLDPRVLGYFEGVCRRSGCRLLIHVSDGVPDLGSSEIDFNGEVKDGLRFLVERMASAGVVPHCLLALHASGQR